LAISLRRDPDVTVMGREANQLSAEYATARAIGLHLRLHAAAAFPTILVPDTG